MAPRRENRRPDVLAEAPTIDKKAALLGGGRAGSAPRKAVMRVPAALGGSAG